MKTTYNILAILLVMTLVLGAFSIVTATTDDHNVVTANNSEFNTLTPTITVNVTGNCTGYLANFTILDVTVLSDQFVANVTNTAITATTATTAGSRNSSVIFWNGTCSDVINQTGLHTYEFNAQPTISSASTLASLVLKGNNRSFAVNWTDQNSSGTDLVTIFICKTNAFTTACTGGQWCNQSTAEADNSTSCNYNVERSLTAGTKSFYAFVLDDNDYASSVKAGNFTVSSSSDEEDQTITAVTQQTQQTQQLLDKDVGGMKVSLIIILVIIVAVVWIIIAKNK